MSELKDITEEYKQERRNTRSINLIIVTGKCFKYKNNYYEWITNLKSKNTTTRKWEEHSMYKSILSQTLYTREINDFNKNFENIINQLK